MLLLGEANVSAVPLSHLLIHGSFSESRVSETGRKPNIQGAGLSAAQRGMCLERRALIWNQRTLTVFTRNRRKRQEAKPAAKSFLEEDNAMWQRGHYSAIHLKCYYYDDAIVLAI